MWPDFPRQMTEAAKIVLDFKSTPVVVEGWSLENKRER